MAHPIMLQVHLTFIIRGRTFMLLGASPDLVIGAYPNFWQHVPSWLPSPTEPPHAPAV